MIFAYNKEHVGDVLLVIVADDQGAENQVKRVGDVARVSLVEAPETVVAWNIFNASALLGDINGTGQVTLTDEQIEKVNTAIKDAGFSEILEKDDTPKIVVGFVKSCKKHPDSDHLSITQTEVDNGEILQIVCGAPNIKAGQKVVVAKPGAMMPDGLMKETTCCLNNRSFLSFIDCCDYFVVLKLIYQWLNRWLLSFL
ncbi:YtpR family tRNA-binding protein [Enterococcus faecalis]